MSGKHFGDAVAEARTVLGMSRAGAAGTMGMTESLLEDIESGLVEMNDALRAVFEDTYGIDLSTVVEGHREHVERKPLTYDVDAGILHVDSLGVRFRPGVDNNDVLLRGFSSAIRRLRRTAPGVPIRLRAADLPMLARLIDLDDPELDDRAKFWFGQDAASAQSFSILLRLSLPPKSQRVEVAQHC